MVNENAWALTRPPAMCPLCQYSCPKVVKGCQDVTPWRHVTSWRLAVTSHDIRWHDKMSLCNLHRSHHKKMSENHVFFFKMASLTFDLWPWPSNLSEILSKAMFLPNFRSVSQTVQLWEHWQTHRQTDRHTDGTDFIPSKNGRESHEKMTLKVCSLFLYSTC